MPDANIPQVAPVSVPKTGFVKFKVNKSRNNYRDIKNVSVPKTGFVKFKERLVLKLAADWNRFSPEDGIRKV